MATKTASKSTAKTKSKKKAASSSKTRKTESKKAAAKPGTTKKTKTKSQNSKKTKAATASKATKTVRGKKSKSNGNGSEKRAILIQQTAYFIAEKRGFEGGDPVQDWLMAEKQVDELLNQNRI